MKNNPLRLIHYSLAFLWIYQGLVPKLLWTSTDEVAIWQWFGTSTETAILLGKSSGVIEIIFGALFLVFPHKILHYLNILGMLALLLGVMMIFPKHLIGAFNPVVMNVAMAALSVVALMHIRQQKT